MKLYITKDQASGMMGGVNFELRVKVELTPEEAQLVKKYKADKWILMERESTIPVLGRGVKVSITIGSLISGQSFKGKELSEILSYEDNVKEACEGLKNALEVMRNFGGQEVFEY